LTPDDIMNGLRPQGRVLVYDDDHYYMGSVVAEQLVGDGLEVVLATPAAVAASWTDYTLEQHRIQAQLLELGVEVISSHSLQEITPDSASLDCVFSGKTRRVEVSAVVMVVSRLPNDNLYRELAADREALTAAGIQTLRAIGDCHGPATIAAAVYEGHRFAREIGTETTDLPYRRELSELAAEFKLP
jgi:dimethylamine/trimethylamine dehydrogenase